MRERLQGEFTALFQLETAVLHGLSDVAVTCRRGHNSHRRVVLRRSAHHGRATDVDLLHALIKGSAGSHGLLKRVQVDHDQLEGLDVKVFELLHVVVFTQVRQNAGVDARVQRLHTAVEHLREPGHIRNLGDVDTGIRNPLCGGAGGNDFNACIPQRACEVFQPCLVIHADQCALDLDTHL